MLGDTGSFPACAEGDTVVSRGTGFRVRASAGAPVEVPQYCDLVLDAADYHDTIRVPLIVGDSMNLPDGPDAEGYAIFDRTDSLFDQRAEYDWVDLRGLGAELGLGSDETVVLPLPAGFGAWRFYGRDYDSLSVCSNGFIAAGSSDRVDFVNVQLPYQRAPGNIVAAVWGRLDASAGGSIRFHHDTVGRCVIVEYDSIRYLGESAFEQVQVQVYDRSVPTPTGDNRIEIHFKTVNHFERVTVGLQNHDGSAGLTHYWNRWRPRTAAPLVPGQALAIEAMAPIGIAEPARMSVPARLSAHPSVFRSRLLVTGGREPGPLAVFDAAGRRVAELAPVRPGEWQWHGRDESGFPCPAGVYFLRAGPAGVRAVFAP
ncbi:MAG TPA: hypothetical protein ENN51_05535 [candidate division WOR-3 bacterium]|uniref:Uncharacterized protein n=1 Tax=candidate division WOR-3 bacterium TaxID=2052148 RepID=A0A7V0XFI5_UNCW3|nr:hypothetical protein [candidate division WOR-3 bacterium]